MVDGPHVLLLGSPLRGIVPLAGDEALQVPVLVLTLFLVIPVITAGQLGFLFQEATPEEDRLERGYI